MKKWAYYNEIDPRAAAWLRELMKHGHIMEGEVDERSITEVKPDDVRGFVQVGFFAGVGFWDLALQLAGWPADRPVWHGSCPCQPWSCAGAGKGHADERHLWPAFRDLILAVRPSVVFGEQVASAAVVGKVGRRAEKPTIPVWIDGVRADMEEAGYAFGASVLGAHSCGAPHIRQRCYWVADSLGGGCAAWRASEPRQAGGLAQPEQRGGACGTSDTECFGREMEIQHARRSVSSVGVGQTNVTGGGCVSRRSSDAELPDGRAEQQPGEPGSGRGGFGGDSESCRAPLAPCGGLGADGVAPGQPGHPEQLQQAGGASDVQRAGLEGHAGDDADGDQPGRDAAHKAGYAAACVSVGGARYSAGDDQQRDRESGAGMRREEPAGRPMPWGEYRVHRYLDGKDRRIPAEPRLFPLADDRHPWHRGRVGLLRGAGNGIVPALAAEFVGAWLDVRGGTP